MKPCLGSFSVSIFKQLLKSWQSNKYQALVMNIFFIIIIRNIIPLVSLLNLKGLAMIFAGQKTPFIIFRGKEIYYISKQITKSP